MSKKGQSEKKSAAVSLVDAKDIPFSGEDFQVLNQFCFGCFRKFDKSEITAAAEQQQQQQQQAAATPATTSTDAKSTEVGVTATPTTVAVGGENRMFSCGLRCGAVFCNRACYQTFLVSRARQHGEVCKETNNARQLVNGIEASRKGKPTRDQVGLCCNEMVGISQKFDDEDAAPTALPSNKPKLSPPDLLLARLLLCRIAFMIGDEDNLCTLLLNSSDSLRDAAALNDSALLYSRKAASIIKRKRGEKSADFAKALNTIGMNLEALNRPAEAKELFERSLQLYESIYRNKTSKQYLEVASNLTKLKQPKIASSSSSATTTTTSTASQ